MRRSLALPVPFLLVASLLFAAVCLGLLGMRGVPGLALAAAGAGVGAFSFVRPARGTQAVLFLLPCLGALDNFFLKSQAIPFLLGPLAGWSVAMAFLLAKRGESKPLPGFLTLLLGVLLVVALAPSLEAVLRYVSSLWPDFEKPLIVRDGDWRSSLKLQNAFGWVLLGLSVMSGGWLMAVFLLKEVPGRLSFGQIFLPLALGLLPSIPLGYLQLFHRSGYLSSAPTFIHAGRINGAFIDPNAFAMTLCFLLPWAVGQLWEWNRSVTRKKTWVYVGGALTSVMGIMLFFTGTRSAFIGLAGCAAVLAACSFFRTELHRPLLKFGAVALILVALLLTTSGADRFPVFSRIAAARQALSQVPLSVDGWRGIKGGRWIIWERAWVLIRQRPWLGSGVGTYLIEGRLNKSGPALPTLNDNAGNYYLQLWQETGLAGLALFLLLSLGTLVRGFRAVASDAGPQRVFVLAGYAGMLAALVFGCHLLRIEVNLLFWLSLALLWREDAA